MLAESRPANSARSCQTVCAFVKVRHLPIANAGGTGTKLDPLASRLRKRGKFCRANR